MNQEHHLRESIPTHVRDHIKRYSKKEICDLVQAVDWMQTDSAAPRSATNSSPIQQNGFGPVPVCRPSKLEFKG